jgi:hypothetical protein
MGPMNAESDRADEQSDVDHEDLRSRPWHVAFYPRGQEPDDSILNEGAGTAMTRWGGIRATRCTGGPASAAGADRRHLRRPRDGAVRDREDLGNQG